MSPGGRSEQLGFLRAAIARIEGGAPALRGGAPAARVKLGDGLALDRLLRGGLLRGTLHEVVAAAPGDAGGACGFALALAARFAAETRNEILWVVEDAAGNESGAPYAPGLSAHGIDPARLVLVRTASGADTLWAMEEALKCRALAAVVADLWRIKPYDLVASRRLVLAAQKSQIPGILVPAGAAGTALSSAARVRFEVAARPSALHRRLALPGPAAWGVRLARIRAGPEGHAENIDWDKIWPLVWDHEEARFRDALPFPPPALPRDRPHPAAASPLPLAGRGRGWGSAYASR